jgi:hypothetical protein
VGMLKIIMKRRDGPPILPCVADEDRHDTT